MSATKRRARKNAEPTNQAATALSHKDAERRRRRAHRRGVQSGFRHLARAAGFGLLVVFFFVLGTPNAAQNQAAAVIRGVVSDVDEQPLAAVRVGIIDQETALMREAQTDAAGRFQVDGLEPDRKHRVAIVKFGYQPVILEDVSPSRSELHITLKPQARRPLRIVPAPSSSTGSSQPSNEPPTVELSSNLVVLNVSVKDAGNNPVPNLQKSNFTVYEDGEPQEIGYFAEEDAPSSVVLLMDVSSSMEGKELQEAKRAALEFINQSRPDNEIAVVAFNDQVRILRAFTRDRAQIRSAIDQLAAAGGTALYDALARAIELMPTARYSRHIILLLSDGKDEGSSKKYSEVERLVQSSDVVIFAVGEYADAERTLFMKQKKYYKDPPLEVNLSPVWVMRQVSDVSGGSAFFPRPAEPLEPLFTLIARELQHQYGIGYVPPPRSGEAKFHRIEVRVKRDSQPGPLTIRTRKGYLE
jgi:VWFA-related protein